MKASFTWATRREGNFGYIEETHPDGSKHVFGPMPSHLVPAFVSARRRYCHYKMASIGATPAVPDIDFTYLQDKPQ